MTRPAPDRPRISAPLRITLLYALFGIAWIAGGDLLQFRHGDVSLQGLALGLAKGFVFVFLSAVLVYVLTRREAAMEGALRQAHKLEAVGRLAGGVAHEFNNILTAIIGHAMLLLERIPAEDERYDNVAELRRAADRAAGITRQLLVFSGKHVTRPSYVDLSALLHDMRAMTARIAGDDVRIELDLAPDLWTVRTDAAQIRQMLLNLVVNAREAMSDAGVLTITTSNVPAGEPRGSRDPLPSGDFVRLAVSDTGRGMSADTLAHLFEPFFTTKEQGTGLGLATVYGIVQQSDGHIRVRSEPGHGATFEIFLPRSAGTPAVPAPGVSRAHDAASLLVVEDDDAVRDLTCRVLRRAGHDVLSARNGSEALITLAAGTSIRLVIADIVMPGMSGFELGEHIRRDHPDIAVLYTSGYVAAQVADSTALEPGTSFLEKPYRPDELLARVAAMLHSRDTPAS